MNHPENTPEQRDPNGLSKDLREQALQIIQAGLEDARTQHPLDVPAVFDCDRPTLSDTVPIRLFRAVRLLGFREVVGSKVSAAILSVSGRSVARKMGIASIQDLVSALKDLSVGRLENLEQTDDRVILTSTECATCSGLPDIGEAICHFETGFIAGGLEKVLGEDVVATETECWGLGNRVCRWEAMGATETIDPNSGSMDNLELMMTLASKAALSMEHGFAVHHKNRELRQAYQRLRESERLKKDLTDMVVHDMRAPLTAIMGSLETLGDLMDSKLSTQEENLLKMAFSSGQTLLNMMNDLLDVSKLEEGKFTCRRKPVSVLSMVERAIDQVSVTAGRKKLTLVIQIAAGLPDVPADKDRIVRLLVNLLGNALQHTQAGGSITVTAAHEPDERSVIISVSDTGEGIPQEYQIKIFDKFIQVESERSRKRFSAGLGLAYCKLVTEAHGGRIWVESRPGEGSTFTFTLPVE